MDMGSGDLHGINVSTKDTGRGRRGSDPKSILLNTVSTQLPALVSPFPCVTLGKSPEPSKAHCF